ncbi:TonB-dependent receptor [uncultured Pseudoteredinibacter sp.]|uniref:TonB-dependent receptor domain-containing protein n=1 Tax=uncultured Pseudoteredinibacter sp. TaxID=1641701 RepID=UPI0026284AD7|nr:TonB-dependent receptor [uncultured Pseudoteredinibacter sp.]
MHKHSYMALAVAGVIASNAAYAQKQANENSKRPAIETVVVIGEQDPVANAQFINTLDSAELKKNQATWIPDLIKTLPNIDILGDNNNPMSRNISIRGLDQQHIATTIDGARYNHYDVKSGSWTIPPTLLKEIDIVNGSSSGAAGGLVRLRTKSADDILQPNSDFGGEIHSAYRSNNAQRLISTTLAGKMDNNFGLLGNYSYSKMNNGELGDGTTIPFSSGDFKSGLLKANWELNENHQLEASMVLFDGRDYRTREEIGHRDRKASNLVVSHSYAPGNDLINIESSIYRNTTKYTVFTPSFLDEGETTPVNITEDKITTTGLSSVNYSSLGDNSFSLGLEVYEDQLNHKLFLDGVETPDVEHAPNAKIKRRALFSVFDWKITDNIRILPSLRYDRLGIVSENAELGGVAVGRDIRWETQLSKGLRLSWEAISGLNLYAAYNEALTSPRISQLFIEGRGFQPNPNLKPEKSKNKEVGAHFTTTNVWTNSDKLSLKLNIFRNDIADFITKEYTDPDFPDGTFINANSVKLSGLEAKADYSFSDYLISASYGQTKGQDKLSGQYLFDMPSDKIRLSFDWNISNEISSRIGLIHAFKNHRVPVEGWYSASRGAPIEYGTLPSKFDQSAKSWTTLDWSMRYEPENVPGLAFNLSATNLTNKYYTIRTYNEERPEKYYEAGRSFNLAFDYKF